MDFIPAFLMSWHERLLVAFLALGLNALFWHTHRAGRFFATPQAMANRAVDVLERRYNREGLPLKSLRMEGLSVFIFITILALLSGFIVERIAKLLPFAWLILVFCVATLLTQRRSFDAAQALIAALSRSLAEARATLTFFAAQDSSDMDENAVVSAGIENIAREMVEGLVAPLAYYLLFGLPGIFVYRAIAIANKSVGRDTVHTRAFGWIISGAAKLLTWPWARLSAAIIMIAAISRGPKAFYFSLKHAWAGAKLHPSNSDGWVEGAMAGALRIRLTDKRWHGKRRLSVPHIGKGQTSLGVHELIAARNIFIISCVLIAALLAVSYKIDFIQAINWTP